MEPKFELSGSGNESILLCPGCKGTYLHQEFIEIFDRKEDEKKGIHVVAGNQNIKIDTGLNGNPSSRRDGLKIHFSCETCLEKPVLAIWQHKGNTFSDFILKREEPGMSSSGLS